MQTQHILLLHMYSIPVVGCGVSRCNLGCVVVGIVVSAAVLQEVQGFTTVHCLIQPFNIST